LSGPFDIIDGKIIKDSKRISLNEVQSLTFHKHAKAWLTSYFIVLLGVGLVGLGLGLVLESDGLLTVGGLGIMLYATIWIYLGNLLSTRLVEHLDCSKWKFSAQ
ncbi:MAG: hypothetical protein KI790_11365, partial [Cyclobacteriaceae bacterium]|nr:hypothetical protein [Cyclobacteriaceae bacterium HetDA_MAG_MS6]